MSTRGLLVMSIYLSMKLHPSEGYYFVDKECLSRYSCTLKVSACLDHDNLGSQIR